MLRNGAALELQFELQGKANAIILIRRSEAGCTLPARIEVTLCMGAAIDGVPGTRHPLSIQALPFSCNEPLPTWPDLGEGGREDGASTFLLGLLQS